MLLKGYCVIIGIMMLTDTITLMKKVNADDFCRMFGVMIFNINRVNMM